MEKNKRTPQQRKALEVYCREMADRLNGAGFDQKATLEHFAKVDLPNTQESVKDLFRNCAMILYPDIESTADLDTEQIQRVYEGVNRGFATRMGISLDWPSDESMMNESLGRKI